MHLFVLFLLFASQDKQKESLDLFRGSNLFSKRHFQAILPMYYSIHRYLLYSP